MNSSTIVTASRRSTATYLQLTDRGVSLLYSPPTLAATPALAIGLGGVEFVTGKRCIRNEELLASFPDRTPEQLFRLTGIRQRMWCDATQSVTSIATEAAARLLDRLQISLADIDLVIACTTSPDCITPSLARRVVAQVAAQGQDDASRFRVPAYDINAACAGWMVATSQAFDFLAARPTAQVLVITSEVLSPLLDPTDFSTWPIFGDAASATVLVGSERMTTDMMQIYRPVLSGMIDTEQSIRVPLFGSGSISMRGDRVYKHAVRTMLQLTERVCQQQQLGLNDLACIVPHQANGRILQYLETATCRPVVRNIEQFGNTSSSTIPMALVQSAQQSLHADRGWRALVTFAGGFISGACLGRLS